MDYLTSIFIYEKIKNQFERFAADGESCFFKNQPLSFESENFLFLNGAHNFKNPQDFYEQQADFSTILNSICFNNELHTWDLGGDKDDFLYECLIQALDSMRIIDVDEIKSLEMFDRNYLLSLIENLDDEDAKEYLAYNSCIEEIKKEIENLRARKETGNHIMIQVKEQSLLDIEEKWNTSSNKMSFEIKLIERIKKEVSNFIIETDALKSAMVNDHYRVTPDGLDTTYYNTSCSPDQLSTPSKLLWKSEQIKKSDFIELTKKSKLIETSDIRNFEIQTIDFEYDWFNVHREWFDESVFKSRFWSCDNKELYAFKYYPTKFFLVRNVKVKKQSNHVTAISNLKINPQLLKMVGKKSVGKTKFLKQLNKRTSQKQVIFNLSKKSVIPLKTISKSNLNVSLSHANLLKRTANISRNKSIKCIVSIRDANSRQLIAGCNLKVFRNGKNVRANVSVVKGAYSLNLNGFYKDYTIQVSKDTYESVEIPIKLTSLPKREIRKTVILIKKNTQSFKEEVYFKGEEMLFIGVVGKEIADFPNPISGVNYY